LRDSAGLRTGFAVDGRPALYSGGPDHFRPRGLGRAGGRRAGYGHVRSLRGPGPPPRGSRRFAALRNTDCRPYLVGAALAMMADNVEHVITYWVLWQKFHSPALAGFPVISHWVAAWTDAPTKNAPSPPRMIMLTSVWLVATENSRNGTRQRGHGRAVRAAVGVHWSLGLSAAALCLATALAGFYALRRRPNVMV
jgi:hypothetical protein